MIQHSFGWLEQRIRGFIRGIKCDKGTIAAWNTVCSPLLGMVPDRWNEFMKS